MFCLNTVKNITQILIYKMVKFAKLYLYTNIYFKVTLEHIFFFRKHFKSPTYVMFVLKIR